MKKYLVAFLSFVLISLLILILIVFILSPGEAVPVPNGGERSISEIEKLEIGGVDQYLFLRGVDSTKAVLLFLHGGPGFSGYHFINDNDNNLEEEFVLAYWEQRGAGKSYSENIPLGSMNIEQMVKDTEEITRYLLGRFGKRKIYLLGHSWGSMLGTLTVQKHPGLYHAYIGIGQMGNQYESEKISLDWLKKEALERNDTEVLKQLETIRLPDSLATGKEWLEYMDVQRLIVGKYGGSTAANKETDVFSIYTDIIFKLPEYTVNEKRNILKGNAFSMSALQDDAIRTNLKEVVDSLELPVHILHGKYDHLVEYAESQSFFEHLKAPEKHFHTFEHSAHRPFADETAKFNGIMTRISRYHVD